MSATLMESEPQVVRRAGEPFDKEVAAGWLLRLHRLEEEHESGTSVTWGEATIDQHQQRIELLMGNAAGNVETASRHQAAIRMLGEAGATCLLEIPAETGMREQTGPSTPANASNA